MDIDRPPVDYLALAASFGVPGTSVTHADDIGDAVREAIAKGGPRLIEVPISS
jgi:benzoylformate decarboxylase